MEMMVTIAIFLVITSALFLTLATGRTYWYSGSVQVTVQQEARRGLEYMAGELRQTRSSKIQGVPADGTWQTSIIFELPQDNNGNGDIVSGTDIEWSGDTASGGIGTIRYSLAGLNNTQLIRTVSTSPGNSKVLANNITSLLFMRPDRVTDVVNIEITAQKQTVQGYPISATLGTEIKLRN